MAPQFQQAGIRLWLYLAPPSETVPDPYGSDYVTWATQCATIAKTYPCVAGLCIDDFCNTKNHTTFTTTHCQSMMTAAHAIDPQLSLLVTGYYTDQTTYFANYIKKGVVDGVIFPYYVRESNNNCFTDTTSLKSEFSSYRTWLDTQTTAGGLTGKMPLITMVYASTLSFATDSPTPTYVSTCLTSGLQATASGSACGVCTYCLPKDQPAFVGAVAGVYSTIPEPGTLVLLGMAGLGLLASAWRKRQNVGCWTADGGRDDGSLRRPISAKGDFSFDGDLS